MKKSVLIVCLVIVSSLTAQNIRFEGNGYSDEWAEEAKARGLSNIKTTPKALDALISEKSTKLFKDTGVFSEREAHARHEILLEEYFKKIQIESRVIGELVTNVVIPAAIKYQTTMVENVKGLKDIGLVDADFEAQMMIIKQIAEHVNFIKKNVIEMVDERKAANAIEDIREKAIAYDEKVKNYFVPIRYHVDKLELLVDDNIWPLPKFRELLFIK